MDLKQSNLSRRLKATEKDMVNHIQYWAEQFDKCNEGHFRIIQTAPISHRVELLLEPALHQRLLKMSNGREESFQLLLFTCFALLLSKYTGQTRSILGTYDFRKTDDRRILPVSVAIDDTISFKELLQAIRGQYLESLLHGQLSLEHLLTQLRLEGKDNFLSGCYGLTDLDESLSHSDYTPLLFHTVETDEGLLLRLTYSADLNIDADHFLEHYVHVVRQVSADPGTICRRIGLLNAERQAQILDWSTGPKRRYEDSHILDAWDRQVDRTPDARAIEGSDGTMSYQEFNSWTNRIGSFLQDEFHIQEGDVVAILCDRGMWPVGIMFATIQTGAAFVGIDPRWPEERILEILTDSGASLLVSHTTNPFRWDTGRQWTIQETPEQFAYSGKIKPTHRNTDAAAYMIYTSGTTGKPKGTGITHAAFMNMIHDMHIELDISPADKVLQFASASFDASVYEVFLALLGGACLLTITGEIIDQPPAFEDYILSRSASVLLLPPVYLSQLNKDRLKAIRVLSVGGDYPIASDLLELAAGGVHCYNLYGPSETAVIAAAYRVLPGEKTPLPVGRPLANIDWYILDKDLNMVPPGLRGELYIGGVAVGNGYHHLPDLTALKFIDNPYGGGKIYRTGDGAYWRADGLTVLTGRMDDQVKIRGQLVEPQEIQSRLARITGIRDAVVIKDREEDGSAVIRAFYTSGEKMTPPQLFAILRESLPSYMLPASLFQVDRIPLTLLGKTDKKALLEIGRKLAVTSNPPDQSPRNQIETDIQEVWLGVLGKSIGLHDHFVNEGGDSIKVIQFCSRLRAKGYQLTVRDVFAHPTIASLATRIVPAKDQEEDRIIQGPIPLSPIQKVFFSQHYAEPWHFNQSAILQLNRPWPTDALQAVFSILLRHHDALRISFEEGGDEPIQVNQPWPLPIEVHVHEYGGSPDALAQIRNASAINQGSLQLAKAPLLRLDHYRTSQGDFLGMTIHHLIVDAVSWGILLEDLDFLLRTYPDGEKALPYKTTAWKTWCTTLHEHRPPAIPDRKLATMRIPVEDNTQPNTNGHAVSAGFALDRALTQLLDQEVHRRYRTNVQDFLLAALSTAIFQIWDLTAIAIDMETHGRQVIKGPDTSRTIGWFTCIYPILLDRSDDAGDDMLIIQTKEAVRKGQTQALAHTLSYIGQDRSNKAGILFNYMGTTGNRQFDSFAWSGIPPGPTQSPLMERMYDWDINAMITEGRLHVNLHYCPGHFQKETIARFMTTMQDHLTHMIRSFEQIRQPLLTPSDIHIGDIDLHELLDWQRKKGLEDVYPLTAMQEGMYYHFLVDRTAGFYSTQLAYALKGDLQVDILKKAFLTLVRRHSGLRSSFIQDRHGRPWQLVSHTPDPEFTVEDISAIDRDNARQYIQSAKQRERERGFDLGDDFLMRVQLFRLGEREYYFLWSYHHIIMDGWCMSILVSEWMKLYQQALNGSGEDLAPVKPYREYIDWLGRQDMDASYAYWTRLLQGCTGGAHIPDAGLALTQINRTVRSSKRIHFDRDRTKTIRQIAAQLNVTLYVLVQGVWGVILNRYTGSSDLVFGTVVSGRPADLDGVESMVGLFINNIPVRIRIEGDPLFSVLLQQLQTQSIGSEPHQYCSLSEIQSRLPGNPALVDHILLFENYPLTDDLERTDSKMQTQGTFKITDSDAFDINNYPFTLTVLPGETMHIRIDYNPHVHTDTLVDHILVYFEEIFTRLGRDADQPVSLLGQLPASLKEELLAGGRGPSASPDHPTTMVDRFKMAVALYGSHIALNATDGIFTYLQLDARSARLSQLLRKDYGAGPGQVIALHMERSAMAFLGIMGILRSGSAYVPIDPEWPLERKQYIIQDAGVRAIVTLFEYFHDLTDLECKLLALDIQTGDGGPSSEVPDALISPEDPGYLIYTSGSTGRSKGVTIRHRSNVNMALDQIRQFDMDHRDHVLQFAPLFFDASVYEWSIAFYSGASLCIPDDRTIKSPELFRDYLEEHEISMMTLPPPFFNLLPLQDMTWPRVTVLAGSAPDPMTTAGVADNTRCYNAYGPTECAVCISVYRVRKADDRLSALPIGRPLSDNSIWLLDEDLNLVPMGAEGEICVSGINVGLGYTNSPTDNQEKFIDHPFLPGERLYRTGDKGRWLPDYLLDFKGRKDRQIKVRGYRIEPGEVEVALKRLDYLDLAVVGEEKDGSGMSILVAWVVANAGWDEKTLKQQLRDHLPAYMIPDRIIEVDDIPLTPNGKVDYSLLKSSAGYKEHATPITPPANEIERHLYEIWVAVLTKDDFGIHDKFFEIGGNSLSLIRVHARLKEFYPGIIVTDIFNYNTISEMAEYILSLQQRNVLDIQAGIVTGNIRATDGPTAKQLDAAQMTIVAPEWDLIRKGMTSGLSDEEMIIAFFCYALYEATDCPVIRLVMLNDTGAAYKGLITADFDSLNSREDLLAHIVGENRRIMGVLETIPLSAVRFNRSEEEIIVACCLGPADDEEIIGSKDIDLLLKSRLARNGDLNLTIIRRRITVGDDFARDILTRMIHITGNLTSA